jgi:hypothetical protein
MHSFKDKEGREWTIDITVSAIKRVRSALQVNLLDIVEGQLLEELENPVLLVDVLYVLCREQCEARKISDEDFGRGMAGDAIDRATSAFLADLSDFFPSGKRQLLSQALEKVNKLRGMALAQAAARLSSDELERRMEKLLSGTSTSWPANSESIPALAPTESSPG